MDEAFSESTDSNLISFDWLVFGIRWFATELGKQLQDAIEVSQSRSVSIDELVHHEIAVEHVLIAVLNFTSDAVQEFCLYLRKCLCRGATST